MAEKMPPVQSDVEIRCGGVSVSTGPYGTRVEFSSNSVQDSPYVMTTTIQSGYHYGPQVVHTVQYGTTGVPLGHQTNHQVAIHIAPPPPTSYYHYSHAVDPIMETANTQRTELVGRQHYPLYHQHSYRQ